VNAYPLCLDCANVIRDTSHRDVKYTCSKFRRDIFTNIYFIPDKKIKFENVSIARAIESKCGIQGKYFAKKI
jgi:hypothetical protein